MKVTKKMATAWLASLILMGVTTSLRAQEKGDSCEAQLAAANNQNIQLKQAIQSMLGKLDESLASTGIVVVVPGSVERKGVQNVQGGVYAPMNDASVEAVTWRSAESLKPVEAVTWRSAEALKPVEAVTWRSAEALKPVEAVTWRSAESLKPPPNLEPNLSDSPAALGAKPEVQLYNKKAP